MGLTCAARTFPPSPPFWSPAAGVLVTATTGPIPAVANHRRRGFAVGIPRLARDEGVLVEEEEHEETEEGEDG